MTVLTDFSCCLPGIKKRFVRLSKSVNW